MTEKLRLRLTEIERRKPITSDEELIEALEKIISDENQKPLRETDTDLISMCVDILLCTEGIDVEAIKKEDEQRSTRIKERVDSRKTQKMIASRKSFRSIVAVASAVFVVLAVTTVGYAVGFEPLKHIIHDVLKIPVGESISEGNREYVRRGETVYFDTIEELIEEIQLTILYPSYLPQDIILNTIRVNDNNSTFAFEFSNNTLMYTIDTYEVFDHSTLEGQLPTYESNNIVYHILDEQVKYTVYFEFQNIQYRLQYNNYDELIKIINSIEEYK